MSALREQYMFLFIYLFIYFCFVLKGLYTNRITLLPHLLEKHLH